MNTQDKRNLVESSKGKFFTAIFTKKDGSLREMNCRMGVKKHLKGGVSTTAHKKNLITVFDAAVEQYRTINLDTLVSLNINGVKVAF